MYSYQVFTQIQKSSSDETVVILMPINDKSLIISQERKFSIVTIITSALTFFTSLLTFYWFLFGPGPFTPWGFLQQRLGLVSKIALERKKQKGGKLIDQDLKLFLKIKNLRVNKKDTRVKKFGNIPLGLVELEEVTADKNP
ncbi:hypothetical protein HK099_006491 [Clydaea vesicula]|uniref:Uncharacterized protein n=1 Tax=Clydaea vesicula TaxID=447962 RepID=A0AAD5TZW0_9FUNG|nr:hypothetical protein HK099_006491 [Clydaea vesicula]KAJ3379576.1 hypothetical protein HDU92_006611 [Lobulomyces angularis]